MQDESTPTRPATDTQHGSEWAAAELARLQQFAHAPANHAELIKAFPGRTLAAVRIKLAHLRRSLNISTIGKPLEAVHDDNWGPTMLAPDDPGVRSKDWQEERRAANIEANREYLARLVGLAA